MSPCQCLGERATLSSLQMYQITSATHFPFIPTAALEFARR
jgi:hypothetical protein